MVNRKMLTSEMIDSRDFLTARRRAETEVMLPVGPKVALNEGMDCNDIARIWNVLDRVHAKLSGKVLLHGGSRKGAERIAAHWADNRKVAQVAFKPNWARHAKAAPFKRNRFRHLPHWRYSVTPLAEAKKLVRGLAQT